MKEKGIAKNQPDFLGLAFRDAFRQALLAGLCLAILWLIFSDFVRLVVDRWMDWWIGWLGGCVVG